MSTAEDLKETIIKLSQVENNEVKAIQKELLEKLYNFSESLASGLKEQKVGGQSPEDLEKLYELRQSLANVQEENEILVTKKDYRIEHLRRNWDDLRKENLELKKQIEELKGGNK